MGHHQIKHRHTNVVLFKGDYESLRACVEAAVKNDADLTGANLADAYLGGADLARAYLADAYLGGADLIDAGQDRRGFRFWAWCREGTVTYRAGCHEWADIETARAWYGESYTSTGDRHECLARLDLLYTLASKRWPTETTQEAA